MTPDWPAMLENAEDLVKAIVPELANVPLYLTPQSAVPAFADVPLRGFTGPAVDLACRDAIGNRWQGRGIGIVLNDRLLADEVPRDMLPDRVNQMTLHEIGHPLARGWAFDQAAKGTGEPQREIVREAAAILAADVTAIPAPDPTAQRERFLSHNATFKRVACHLAHRGRALGFYLPVITVIGYGPGHRPEAYDRCLMEVGEYERMAVWPFADIVAAALPARFAELWQRDLEEFERGQTMQANEPAQKALTRLANQIKARQEDHQAAYQRLVRTIADAKTFKEPEAEGILSQAGKTVANLSADVAAVLRRRELVKKLQDLDGLETEQEEINRQAEALDGELTAAQAKHDEAAHPLIIRAREIEQRLRARAGIEEELRKTAGPELKGEQQSLSTRQGQLTAQQRTLDQQRQEAERAWREATLENTPRTVGGHHEGPATPAQADTGRLKQLQAEVETLRQASQAAGDQVAELALEQADLERRVLTTA